MNPSLRLAPRAFPDRIAELGFTAQLPVDWTSHDLPTENVDFSDPTLLVPLAIVTAPHAAIVFAFAARPAYEDGTVHDWATYLLNHNQLQARAIGRDVVAGVPAVVGEATQPSELGTVVVRFAFLEDGNRLLNLTLTAPELFADSVRDAWFRMLQSFTLATPRGSRFKSEPHPDAVAAAPIPAPWLEAKPTVPAPHADVLDSESGEPLLTAKTGGRKLPEHRPGKTCGFGDFALDDDSISLDEDHAINVNLRDRGVGLIPNIVGLSDEFRRASLAAGAIMAQFDVPYGWHVIDDGKRTLVFEPGGKVQISMGLLPREGRTNGAILDDLEATARAEYPAPEFARLTVGKIDALGVRGIADGEQPIEQYHMLIPFRDDSMVLRARVTATPEQAANACNLAELILGSCVFDPVPNADEPEPTPEPSSDAHDRRDGQPLWWHQALALEAEGKLEAAEKQIRDAVNHIGFASSTAEMYRLRMLRLKQAGDKAGALEAFLKSSDFIASYAGMATSGGEGAALSLERDEFRSQLVREYGGDPEAKGGR